MDLLRRLKDFINQKKIKIEKEVEEAKTISEELKKLEEYISKFDLEKIPPLKEDVKKFKIFDVVNKELFYQIEKIEKIQKFMELVKEKNYDKVEINLEQLSYFKQETIQKTILSLNTLKKLNKYVNDDLFDDEELKKIVLNAQKEFNNILEEELKNNINGLLNTLRELQNNYVRGTYSRNSSVKKYKQDFLQEILLYDSLFDEKQVLSPFKTKKEMQEFFEFLKNSTLGREDVFQLIVLFGKFNLDYYNKLKNKKDSTIKNIVDKNVQKATKKLESLVEPTNLIESEPKVENEPLQHLTEEELKIYNSIKKIIDDCNVIGYDDDYYELFIDDFEVKNRKEYYFIGEEINWKIIKTDFKKILEPNISTNKEEIFAIFNYIIEIHRLKLKETEKNNKMIAIIKEQKQTLEQILSKKWNMYGNFINKYERKKISNYFNSLDFNQQNEIQQYADSFNITVEELKLFYILYQIDELRKNIEEIVESKKMDEDLLNLINEEYKILLDQYKTLAESNLLDENLDSKIEIDANQKNFLCILNKDIFEIADKNMRTATISVAKRFKYDEWSRLSLVGHVWDVLKYKGSNGKEKDYSKEAFAAGRIRQNDYRIGLVIVKNICEENKEKIKKKYKVEKIGVIGFVIGVAYVKANHDAYADFNKFINDNRPLIDEYVNLFKDPSTPEEVLFEIIENGIIDFNLLEVGKGGKSL